MTPILNNICSLQIELMSQWYKSCDATLRSLTHVLDHSPGNGKLVSRQKLEATKSNDQGDELAKADRKQKKPVKTGLAIVTGGIGGIGTEICKRLATDGNRVIATYIAVEADKAVQWQKDLEKEGYDTDVFECDVASFESCKLFARQIEKKCGPVDILVNAAGITRDSMLRKMEPAKWHAVIDTNLDSVFNVTRNFINGMIKNKYGRIINISSVIAGKDKGKKFAIEFNMLHITPPQSPPEAVKNSTLANSAGFVDVHPHTLQHTRYKNVFALGDVCSTPNEKTVSAIMEQTRVVDRNVLTFLRGGSPDAEYDGYSFSPVSTARGKTLFTEYSYGGQITPKVKWNSGKELRINWWIKRLVMPVFYWHYMLKGYDWLPGRNWDVRELDQKTLQ